MSNILFTRYYLNPWRLFTLWAGVSVLIMGAQVEHLRDWDDGVSLAMALATYLLMPYIVLFAKSLRTFPIAVGLVWFCVDGSYLTYWSYFNPIVMDRVANFNASIWLFALTYVAWIEIPELAKSLDVGLGGFAKYIVYGVTRSAVALRHLVQRWSRPAA